MKKRTIEELGLRAVFGIGKQRKCLLLDFCTRQELECNGERIPWCRLEVALTSEDSPAIVNALKRETLIKALSSINSGLYLKNRLANPQQFLKGFQDFQCPYFGKIFEPCDFHLCPYHSAHIKTTSCMLSVKNDEQKFLLTELAIAKNIPKKKLLNLVLSIEAGDKWERVKLHLQDLIKDERICKKCGSPKVECKEDPDSCKRKKILADGLKNSALIPEGLKKYPMSVVILAAHKVFGNWAPCLFPQRPLESYMKSLTKGEYHAKAQPK